MYNFDRQIHAEIEWGYYMYLLDEYVGERAKAMNNRLTNEFESAELENSIKILKINIDLHEKFVKRILEKTILIRGTLLLILIIYVRNIHCRILKLKDVLMRHNT